MRMLPLTSVEAAGEMAQWGKEILGSLGASDKYSEIIGGSGQCKTNLPLGYVLDIFLGRRETPYSIDTGGPYSIDTGGPG